MSQSDNTEYIARISYGKDSLKMDDNPTEFRCMNFEGISLFGGNYGK